MKKTLKILMVQQDLVWKKKAINFQRIENRISQFEDIDIILLPEMFNTSFCPKYTSLAESMNGTSINWMLKISRKYQTAISGTIMVKEGKSIYNRLIWISKEGKRYTYDKRHLFSLVGEDRYLTRGKKRLILEEQGWKICPLICYDLRFPVFSRNNVNYEILIFLANWPEKRIEAWDTLLKARAIENQCYVVGVNRVGIDKSGTNFSGGSKVFDGLGKQIFSASDNNEEVVEVKITKTELRRLRKEVNFLRDQDIFTVQ